MVTQPTNPLVVIAADDVNLPQTGQPNKTVPSNNILTTGYDKDQSVFAEHLNYTLNNLAQWIDYLNQKMEQERVSIGEIIEITGNSTNPAELKGYGTWESVGEGQVLVGVGEHSGKTWTDGQSEGEYEASLTEGQLPAHNHTGTVTVQSETHSHTFSGTTSTNTHKHTQNLPQESSGSSDRPSLTNTAGADEGFVNDGETENDSHSHTYSGTTSEDTHNHAASVSIDNSGSGESVSKIQPTLAVYRWKRVS